MDERDQELLALRALERAVADMLSTVGHDGIVYVPPAVHTAYAACRERRKECGGDTTDIFDLLYAARRMVRSVAMWLGPHLGPLPPQMRRTAAQWRDEAAHMYEQIKLYEERHERRYPTQN